MDILIRSFLCFFRDSITASIAGLLIILILKLFDKHISVRLQHALWIIVVIRLIIPVEFQSNLSLLNLLHENHQNSSNIENKSTIKSMTYAASDFLREGKIQYSYTSKNQISKVNQSPSKIVYSRENIIKEYITSRILGIASFIWIVGVFSIAAFLSAFRLQFKRKILNLEEVRDLESIKLLNECKNKVNITRDIPVYICDNFKSPCTLGIIKPKVYIPKCVCTKNNLKQLYYIFLHELIHYKRMDLVYNFLAVLAVILHWFNPIVWFCMKRMKLQRECACDTYVLEIIGEEKAEDYGMTLINFSKLVSSNKVPRLAVFFETKNQIKRRIEMIKNFKKGSYKMSAAAVICCVLASGAILTTAVNAKSMKAYKTAAVVSSNNSSVKNQNSKFLIDAPIKYYDNLKRAEEVTGFKVKVPDYIPTKYVLASIHVIKVSDTDNSLEVSFSKKDGVFNFQASKVDMEQCLKQIAEDQSKGKVEVNKEAMNLEGINGYNITIKRTLPMGYNYKIIDKCFIWQNEGVWYSIGYSIETQRKENKSSTIGIPIDDVGKIATSIKYDQDVKNVSYSIPKDVSTEVATLPIYDKEDLKKAKELLGFNPKFPLSINKNITIKGSLVGISGDSHIKNKKIGYELGTFYNLKNGLLVFTQGKSSKAYDDMSKKANTIKIDGKEVLKYETYEKSVANKQLKEDIYVWKENGFYCEVSIMANIANQDEIVKGFVDSKPID
ncbi:M56 family metallopeptidase [Clostridium autoethanogenum]|uniref:M56 family metallopeptidase n=1 Tax=Clostridium autoethanogenum DSM 10061 TaxID=1341692 RepID=A0ABN4BH14_9CLOT|nr:M56 family metallopeptidase [Clostridium autoethanogenum]AGY76977.1 M56 family metallopeptidase [Clostridium autoethanogenum DSM 10061]ALU37120.1 BlaR1 peptidase M56 [Clostridium autoethanogenum DSM 10061]OVY50307.1 Regulatory protein BlaR1 [Clostridium autoethanogenum]